MTTTTRERRLWAYSTLNATMRSAWWRPQHGPTTKPRPHYPGWHTPPYSPRHRPGDPLYVGPHVTGTTRTI